MVMAMTVSTGTAACRKSKRAVGVVVVIVPLAARLVVVGWALQSIDGQSGEVAVKPLIDSGCMPEVMGEAVTDGAGAHMDAGGARWHIEGSSGFKGSTAVLSATENVVMNVRTQQTKLKKENSPIALEVELPERC